jgi:hypothetical protein
MWMTGAKAVEIPTLEKNRATDFTPSIRSGPVDAAFARRFA